MSKKTVRRPASPGNNSSVIQTPGLIAKAGKPQRSARAKCVLDNRSLERMGFCCSGSYKVARWT
jgi:hypothetical protein